MDMITAYVSEQTNSRRPGLRLVCSCGWGVVAVHADQGRPLADIIADAMEHAHDAHGIDEIRADPAENRAETARNRATRIEFGR